MNPSIAHDIATARVKLWQIRCDLMRLLLDCGTDSAHVVSLWQRQMSLERELDECEHANV
jgi:hypothetical protein